MSTTSFGLAVGEPHSVRPPQILADSHFCQRSLMAVLPAGFATLKYKIQEYKMQEGRECRKLPCSCGQFIHSAQLRSSIRFASFRFAPFMLRFFPLSVRFIPSLTSEPRRKRSSVHFAFRANALVSFRVPTTICNRSYPDSSWRERGTPHHFSERSVQSLPFLLPARD